MSGASGAASGIAATVERLATLQNLIKRDPEAYREEFGLQHQHFLAELDILKLNPAGQAETFTALTNFLAHVCSCFPKELLPSFPEQLMSLLAEHADLLNPEVRRSLAQALILMRNKGTIEAIPVHKLFFSLLRVRDRTLRQLLQGFIVHDIRTNNRERKDETTNRAIQGMLYGLITEGAGINGPKGSSGKGAAAAAGTGGLTAAHRALRVLIELYRRHVWRDAKTVNAIANGLLSPHTRLLVTSLNFFLGIGSDGATEVGDDDDDDGDDQDSDGELPEGHVDVKAMKQAMQKHAHSKHTAKRMRQTERMIAGLKKNARKAASNAGPAFPAIQLLHDPQGVAERLFARLRTTGEKFEIRLLMMNLVSRLIGQHRLMLLPFYSFVTRYLKAHQQRVTQVLAYLVQACHDLVPPDEVFPVLRAIASNFIHDGATNDVLQVGLNAFREVVAHCPVVLEEEGMRDLLQDLVAYKKFSKHTHTGGSGGSMGGTKGVVASARALLNLVRDIFPSLLKKKDWGKDVATGAAGTDKAARPTSYGYQLVATGVEGADLLALVLARKAQKRAAEAAARAAAAYDSDEDDEDSDDDDEREGTSSVARSSSKRSKASSAAAAAAAASMVTPAQIAAVADEDEWEVVDKAKKAALRKANKPLPQDIKDLSKRRHERSKKGAKEADQLSDASEDAELVEGLLEGEDSDDHHGHSDDEHGHVHGPGCNHDHDDDDEADDDSEDEDEDDDDEEEDDSEDEEEELPPAKGKKGAAVAAAAVAGKKRGRAASEDDEEEEEEERPSKRGGKKTAAAAAPTSKRRKVEPEEEESSDEDEEEEEDDHMSAGASSGGAAGSKASSGAGNKKAAVAAALAASVAPLLAGSNSKNSKTGSTDKQAASSSSSSSEAPASEFRPFQLEAERLLTPKDFARIKAIRSKLAEKGFTDAKAKDVLKAMLQSSAAASTQKAHGSIDSAMLPPAVAAILDEALPQSDSEDDDDEDDDHEEEEDGSSDDDEEAGAGEAMEEDEAKPGKSKLRKEELANSKKKRRGGRGLGYASDESSDDEDSDDEEAQRNQLAMPGMSYFPPVVSFNPQALESDVTRKKRREAERLASVVSEKQTKWEGKKAGGGTTNKEKARKKNFLMLRKSSGVQQKLKTKLSLQQKAVRGRLTSKANTDKRRKQKRRRV